MNIPVYRNNPAKAARSFVRASQEAKKGWSLMIFPEGGIPEESPKVEPFKDGAFKLSKHLKIPIVPITFKNNYQLFSDPTQILGPAHPGISRVVIHENISVEMIETMSSKELNQFCYNVISSEMIDSGAYEL